MSEIGFAVDCTVSSCGCGCSASDRAPFEVKWRGAQKNLLAGDTGGKVNLEELAELGSLYGLGPLEEVSGEITILDSKPYIAKVTEDGGLRVESGFRHRACFLVYTQVERWQRIVLPEDVVDEKTLEAELPQLAAQHGIDADAPFPFLLRGQPDRVVFHVLNKTDREPHSPELHEKAKVKYRIEDDGIEVIGFYSDKHRGIFTPGHSSLHMHVITDDGAWSGHLDALSFPQGLDLYLPVD